MVSRKLNRFRAASKKLNAWENNDGNRCLIEISDYFLSRIDIHLGIARDLVKTLRSICAPKERQEKTSKLIDGLIKNCAIAERLLKTLESTWHPFLIARDERDAARHDQIVSRLLSEVTPGGVLKTNPDGASTRILAIMCHKLKIDSAVTVFAINMAEIRAFHAKREKDPAGQTDIKGSTERVAGILCFFPSIWSFSVITLLLHEIGHIVWDHCIQLNEKKKLTRGILRAFPHAFGMADVQVLGTGDKKLCGEVAADMFAALVGGYAYGTSLCGFFMTKTNHWKKTAPGYLNIGDRIGLVRRACEYVVPDCPGRDDSYWSAIEGLKKHLDENPSHATSSQVHQQKGQNEAIGEIIKAFEKCLLALGVRLANTVTQLPVAHLEKGPETKGKTIRDSLAWAAKYRNDCAAEDGSDYIKWEKEAMRDL